MPIEDDPPIPLPHGSSAVASWAHHRRMGYEAVPGEHWLREWEPYDTMVSPQHYFNACTWTSPRGHIVVAEPWTAPAEMEPLERTLLGFGTHPGLYRRAAMRVGEPFLTRVTFLESPPPPTVQVGDKVWDENVTTFAASPTEAAAGFHGRLRHLLQGWGFKGHLELRPGGLCVHYDGLRPVPQDYDRLMSIVGELIGAATRYPSG